ncbi:uncharacterized protein TNCV_590001 [Trichonephila clavipes]|nr:uncharacterized protein TNCV_590001 [Trichonephila clavipes]
MDGSQISCAALRALALNSREQLIREKREDPELGHIYRYLENPDDDSVNATVCEAGGLIPIVSNYPNEIVTLDLLGPYPASRPERYRFLLVITDHFTKWSDLIPLRKASAQAIANALFENYISRNGTPISLISDNNLQFISELFEHLSHRMDIKHIKTGPQSIPGPSHQLYTRQCKPPIEESRQGARGQYDRTRETRTTSSKGNSAAERRPVHSRQATTAVRPCPYYLRSHLNKPEGIPEVQRSTEIDSLPQSNLRRRSLSMEALDGDPVDMSE